MDYSSWLTPEYMGMVAIITLALKFAIIPFVKNVLMTETHLQGYTPIIIAFVAALTLSFLYKFLQHVGIWDSRGVIMTILVAIFAACSAIGLNVTTQALKGKDVSINNGF